MEWHSGTSDSDHGPGVFAAARPGREPEDVRVSAEGRIGILGDDPFGPFLDETVRGERVGARPIQVRRYHRIADIEECNILFISRSENERVPEILSALKHRPVLTVSDGDGFASQGGIIQFFTDKNRIRIRINLDAAEAANLTISSKLLRVAEVVRTPRR